MRRNLHRNNRSRISAFTVRGFETLERRSALSADLAIIAPLADESLSSEPPIDAVLTDTESSDSKATINQLPTVTQSPTVTWAEQSPEETEVLDAATTKEEVPKLEGSKDETFDESFDDSFDESFDESFDDSFDDSFDEKLADSGSESLDEKLTPTVSPTVGASENDAQDDSEQEVSGQLDSDSSKETPVEDSTVDASSVEVEDNSLDQTFDEECDVESLALLLAFSQANSDQWQCADSVNGGSLSQQNDYSNGMASGGDVGGKHLFSDTRGTEEDNLPLGNSQPGIGSNDSPIFGPQRPVLSDVPQLPPVVSTELAAPQIENSANGLASPEPALHSNSTFDAMLQESVCPTVELANSKWLGDGSASLFKAAGLAGNDRDWAGVHTKASQDAAFLASSVSYAALAPAGYATTSRARLAPVRSLEVNDGQSNATAESTLASPVTIPNTTLEKLTTAHVASNGAQQDTDWGMLAVDEPVPSTEALSDDENAEPYSPKWYLAAIPALIALPKRVRKRLQLSHYLRRHQIRCHRNSNDTNLTMHG